ncbi:putative addiction module antidote protein [Sphingobium yanoikuyae]|uniref:Putative addiction module antidote protein n=2 Tax=Sphingobium yanoikuyae TaxID=13690 RepID=A0A291N7I4_SPHYA|nr:putative addiction module antidote protein [Sphingobium yanoikuyae]ATI83521.1 putative addiction module antidote protein [Sphingobium yanoikuyae]
MAIKTEPWDAAEFLGSEEDIRHYLEAAFEDGDPVVIRSAFADVARARGMTALAKDAGVSRETLYKAFAENGNPTLDTLMKVTKALGVRLSIAA